MSWKCKRQIVAVVVAAVAACAAVPVAAAAATLPETYRGSDAAQQESSVAPSRTDRSDAAQGGWGAGERHASTFPSADFRGGDSPIDHPGASRAPTTIEVVRPERTIVRDVDEELPLILSSTALMLVLAGFGVMLVRGGTLLRPRSQ